MAHELTHVLQQRTGSPTIQRQPLTPEEREKNLKSEKYAGNGRLQNAFDNNPPLKIFAQGEAVRLVQEGLVADGFAMPVSTKASGELDGIFGAETFRVVKQFQQKYADEGLLKPTGRPDGIVGRHTMGKLDQLAPPLFIPPKRHTIPEGAVPPTVKHMSGKFGFNPRARDPSVEFPVIFLGPDPSEGENPRTQAGIHFRAVVNGGSKTRGSVFYVQNVKEHLVRIQMHRAQQRKDCQSQLERPMLDSEYPYSQHRIQFKGSFLTIGHLPTADSPSVFGFAQESFKPNDLMDVFTAMRFRMFLVWDPRETAEKPPLAGAQPISLGFVDWGWAAATTFEAQSSVGELVWNLRVMGGKVFGGGSMQSTPEGAPIVLDPIITDVKLGNRLREACRHKDLGFTVTYKIM